MSNAVAKVEDHPIEYVPFGMQEKIKLTIGMVKQFLVKPTKSGKIPSNEDITKFMMLCKARELNPWEGDSYFIGYDSQDGPEFSMITAYQAFLKRAEACQEYDGKEQGIVVKKSGDLKEINGEIIPEGYVLVGGWAKVYRKDRSRPEYQVVNLAPYDKGRSLWNKDKSGMIVKCAVAKALRHAFPNKLAQMYIAEEREPVVEVESGNTNGNGNGAAHPKTSSLKDDLKAYAAKNNPAAKSAEPAANGEQRKIIAAAGLDATAMLANGFEFRYIVGENGDQIIDQQTGEAIPLKTANSVSNEKTVAKPEKSSPAATDETEQAKNHSGAPYPEDWAQRRKVEKPKGYDLFWSDKTRATQKFLEKLHGEKIVEAGYELAFRAANE